MNPLLYGDKGFGCEILTRGYDEAFLKIRAELYV
jgi:hypothetical protein